MKKTLCYFRYMPLICGRRLVADVMCILFLLVGSGVNAQADQQPLSRTGQSGRTAVEGLGLRAIPRVKFEDGPILLDVWNDTNLDLRLEIVDAVDTCGSKTGFTSVKSKGHEKFCFGGVHNRLENDLSLPCRCSQCAVS